MLPVRGRIGRQGLAHPPHSVSEAFDRQVEGCLRTAEEAWGGPAQVVDDGTKRSAGEHKGLPDGGRRCCRGMEHASRRSVARPRFQTLSTQTGIRSRDAGRHWSDPSPSRTFARDRSEGYRRLRRLTRPITVDKHEPGAPDGRLWPARKWPSGEITRCPPHRSRMAGR